MITLNAAARGLTKSARTGARRAGDVPGVLYGKDVSPTPITIDGSALKAALKAGARHRMISLVMPGDTQPQQVIIKDLQYDERMQELVHVDFMRPALGRRLHVRVPLVVRGGDALIRRGIILEHQLQEIDCECMPDNVPEAIYIDATNCNPGEHVSLGELKAPPGVKVSGHPDTVVVSIVAPMATMIPGEGDINVTTVGG